MIRSAALVALLLAALPAAAQTDAARPDAARTDAPPATVRLFTVEPPNGAAVRRFVGRVEAKRTVDLSFQRPGLLVDLPVTTGDALPEGALLAALDTADFELALRRTEARLKLTRSELERSSDLADRGAGTQSRLDVAEAEAALAEVDHDDARRALELTRITAPFDALVARRLVDAFTYVTPQVPVVRVQDVSELRAVISVPESLVGVSRTPGAFRATARLAALPDETFALELREFITEADPVAQTYEVAFALPVPRDPRILPGMTATVEIRATLPGAGAGPLVPATAVDTRDGFHVWVHDADTGTVQPQAVQLGLPQGDLFPVLEGLNGGETLVAAGVSRLQPGQRVRAMAF